jgi:hypothetical protein
MVLQEDVYNMDETGVLLSVLSTIIIMDRFSGVSVLLYRISLLTQDTCFRVDVREDEVAHGPC